MLSVLFCCFGGIVVLTCVSVVCVEVGCGWCLWCWGCCSSCFGGVVVTIVKKTSIFNKIILFQQS